MVVNYSEREVKILRFQVYSLNLEQYFLYIFERDITIQTQNTSFVSQPNTYLIVGCDNLKCFMSNLKFFNVIFILL